MSSREGCESRRVPPPESSHAQHALALGQVIPGYGGGMSSAKAALESDTRVLAYEAGRKYGIRVNTISAGPLGSRAAKAIGFIDDMIQYSSANSPLPNNILMAEDVRAPPHTTLTELGERESESETEWS
jgi:enoyl-[acyl-carrier-protein] reductase (NADH)